MEPERALRVFLREYHVDLTRGVLVAVSGGVDSMVLLDTFRHLHEQRPFPLAVLHIDHRLRKDSGKDRTLVATYCHEHEISFAAETWIHDALSGNVEAAARAFRYQEFATYMQAHDLQYLATAHHADDVAETVLMRLIHGASAPAVAGLRALSPLYTDPTRTLIRPFYRVEKPTLYAYAETHGVPFHEDDTNQALTYTRNRMRHQILPLLKEEDTAVVAHLGRLNQEWQGLFALAERYFEQTRATWVTEQNGTWILDLAWLTQQAPSVQHVLLGLLLAAIDSAAFATFGYNGIEALRRFLAGGTAQGTWDLPAPYHLRKAYDTATITTKPAPEPATWAGTLAPNGRIAAPFGTLFRVSLEEAGDVERLNHVALPADVVHITLTIRPRRAGDRVRIAQHHQKLTRYYINHKVPQIVRDRALVVASETQEVLALLDPVAQRLFAPAPASDAREMLAVAFNA